MGTNKRYGSDLTDGAVDEVMIRPQPVSLTREEIGNADVTTAAEPIPVSAWVRFSESPIHVSARAIAWTDRAVHVELTLRDGSTRRVWVWTSAVSRR